MACAPLYAKPSNHQSTFQAAALWAIRMGPHAGQLHLHALNGGGKLRAHLNSLPVPRNMLHFGHLQLHAWDFYDEHSTEDNARAWYRRPPWDLEGLNLMYATDIQKTWAWQKCLVEQRGSARWMMIMDVDEYWGALPPAAEEEFARPPLTLQQFVTSLPAHYNQILLCQRAAVEDTDAKGLLNGPQHMDMAWPHYASLLESKNRSKAAVRLDGDCEFWAYPHFSIPDTGLRAYQDTAHAACRTLWSDKGTPLRRFDIHDVLHHFKRAGCHPPSRYFIGHARQLRNDLQFG